MSGASDLISCNEKGVCLGKEIKTNHVQLSQLFVFLVSLSLSLTLFFSLYAALSLSISLMPSSLHVFSVSIIVSMCHQRAS